MGGFYIEWTRFLGRQSEIDKVSLSDRCSTGMSQSNLPNSPKPVLYAEDEEDDVFFMRRAFTDAGIRNPLVIVPNGQEAIDYLLGAGRYSSRDECPLPCLLLLDLKLPKKSGMEVLHWIRTESAISTLPVVILTSSPQDADIQHAYFQGANAYLVKPSAPEELVRMASAIQGFWLTENRTAEKSWEPTGLE